MLYSLATSVIDASLWNALSRSAARMAAKRRSTQRRCPALDCKGGVHVAIRMLEKNFKSACPNLLATGAIHRANAMHALLDTQVILASRPRSQSPRRP
jgi:hypothetical protein